MSTQNWLEQWRRLPLTEVFKRGPAMSPRPRPAIHAEVLARFYPDYPLLPIEFLKHEPDKVEAGFAQAPVHAFLSSGTTMRDRSRSSFSQEGLDLYREFSLQSFRAMLEPFFGKGSKTPGISMIPSVPEWPTSSLAQMIGWIGEEFPLQYWDDSMPAPTEPVWFFATGFHIVAFADAGGRFQLPKGSIVVETGGTKGKTRSVTREESYALIEKCFGVDRNHIVSEYGMCELASQAYDFVAAPKAAIVNFADRWFRFPAWAETRILSADQSVQKEGDGTLIIDDRIRSDIGAPFRTEDRVILRADGAFQLKGRVAFSPLKGCSMMAEDLLKAKSPHITLAESLVHAALHTTTREISFERAREIHHRTQTMLKDPRFYGLLQQSLGLEQLVQWCLQDLKESVPESIEAWLLAAEKSRNSAESWLIIGPRSHDIAIMHPLFLAALLDLRIVVRAPRSLALLDYWRELFGSFFTFEILDESWRVTPGEALPCHSLMAFGSDETILALREATPQPVQGFGNWLTLSVIHEDSWAEDSWVKDAFSLKQEGCMSSRLLFVWADEAPAKLKSRKISIGQLTHADHLHLAHSELDFALEDWELIPRDGLDALVVGQRRYQAGLTIEAALSSRPLTLPVLRVSKSELEGILKEIQHDESFKLISADEPSLKVLQSYALRGLCPIGKANAAKWTGEHGGRPLFFPEG